jgi:hypothetical protein
MPRKNFAPRVGLAWDPFGDGKTSVRAAFGVYDVLIQFPNYGSAIGSSWPGLQSTNSAAITPGDWPKGTFQSGSLNLNTKRVDYIEQSPPTNYAMQWNLNIQHQFTNSLTASVAYVGTRSVHNVFQMDDSNVALPLNMSGGTPLWPCGVLTPAPAGQPFDPTTQCSQFGFYQGPLDSAPVKGDRLNPYVGREPTQLYNSSGIYHGLQVGVLKSAGHGLTVSGSYTFSRNISTSDGTGIGDPYVNSISSSLFWFNQSLRRGPADTNITHNLVVSYMYNVPDFSGAPHYLQPIVNGWETGGILTVQSGQPFTPQISGDSIGENNTDPINYPDRLGGTGCQSLVNPGNVDNYIKLQCFAPAPPVNVNGTFFLRGGNLGRNGALGPGLVTLDFSLFKNNYIRRISETFNAQIRFEAFNVLNHPNFSPPTDNQFLFNTDGTPVPGAGAIDLTTTTSRQLQLAVKIIF